MSRLSVEHLAAGYGDLEVLHDLSLDLPSGRLHAILGPSGCGKSTLLRCIAGLKESDAGRVLVDGEDVTHLPPERRGIVLLHQENALFPHLTVGRNVGFGLRLRAMDPDKIQRRVEEMLQLVDLPGYEKRRTDQLSGGERQRVALARALAVAPRILLLDEPLSHLDEPLRVALRSEIRRILRGAQATAYYVTHDREEAFAVADEVVLLDAGRVVDQGPSQRVYERPASPDAARLLGRRNVVPYVAQPHGKVETPLGPLSGPDSAGQRGHVLLPEEQLQIRTEGEGTRVLVEAIEYLGGRFVVRVQAGPHRVWVQADRPDGLQAGNPALLDLTDVRPLFWPES